MDPQKISQNVASTIELLKSIKGTSIKEFIELEPKNDLEYLKAWFYYIQFLGNKKDFIEGLMTYGVDPDKYIFGHELKSAVEDLFLTELKRIRQNLGFEPRLEQYLKEFEEDERDFVRIIILAILWLIKQDNLTFESILGLSKDYGISETFAFTLNENHRLFRDNVIKLDTENILQKNFFGRDISTHPLVFSIFANLPVSEMDKTELVEIGLAKYFGIITDEYLQSMIHDDPEIDLEDEWEDEDFDDDIDSILSELENESLDEEEAEKIQEISETTEVEEIKLYKTDAEFFLEEFEYFKMLSKIVSPDYEDSADMLKRLPSLAKSKRKKCDLQLKESIKAGFRPRFEKLAKDLRLSTFEKNVMKCLISSEVFAINDPWELKIGELIRLLENNPLKHLEYKKYFKKSAKLIKSGMLHVEERWDINTTIFECEVKVDSRLVELLTGESFDISEYIEGSYLYSSGIKMENVILPDEDKKKVLELIRNFDKIQKARKKVEFDKHFEYGNALVMLFTGPSGTGKTMLANAISQDLDKKILLFNLNNLAQMSSIEDGAAIFQTLFREARLNDAVLFFDESEAILSQRFNDLLIELERHTGVVIFATNASFEIDPAMRRRILHFTNFKDPGPILRREIWRVHLYDFPKNLKLADDINLDFLASKYEISGGLIKNAIFTALVKAVNDSDSDDPNIVMKNLMEGAKEQLDNKFFMSKMEKVRIPQKGLESLVVSDKVRHTIDEIVNYEKARKVLEGQWGFSEIFPDKNGVAVLFYGPPGTGKTHTAEAIAYETGKTLKQVNYAQIVSKYVGETEKALEALFSELADNKSILLFDEADALFAKRTSVSGSNSRYLNMETDLLLSLIERNNVFAILTTNNLENIDDAFYRRMTYIINFDKPNADLRTRLWETLIPKKLPVEEKIDYALLANKFDFTGAEIKNVIIRTATIKALKLEENPMISTEDFLETCEDLIRPDHMERRRVGF